MPLTPGQGIEQGITPPPAERGPREIKQYPITVDGERTFYPENYPHQFIVDGPPASIRRIMGGIDGDRSKLGPAINAYLRPSQEVFSNTPPDWYNQTLAPILERMHLSLDNLKPEDLHILGDGFRGALDRVYDFSFPKDAQFQAARNMGQTEGTVPTLSELMKTLKETDFQKYIDLFEQLIAKGPDGFVMGAYLAAPEEDKAVKPEETEPEFDLDKVVKRDETGRVHIDQQSMQHMIDTTWQTLHEGFDNWTQHNSSKSYTSFGPNGEPYRMRIVEPSYGLDHHLPQREPIGFDAWEKINNTTAYKPKEPIDQGTNNVSHDASDKILHPEQYRLKETPSEE